MSAAIRYARPIPLIVILSAACSAGDSGYGGEPDNAAAISPDAIHVVGTTETIARIRDMQPTPDGPIWVLNSVEPFFIALDETGREVRSLGKEGGGPDEFRTPNALVGDSATGDVWAYDRAANTLVRVSDPDESRTVLTLSRDSLPPGRMVSMDNAGAGGRYWIRPSSDGFLFGRARPDTDNLRQVWNMDVVRHGTDGAIVVLFSPADHLVDPTTLYGDASEFMPFPLIDVCGDGSFALYDPASNALRRFSPDGALTDSVTLPEPQLLEPSADRLFAMVYPTVLEEAPPGALPESAAIHGMLKLQWADISRQMAPVLPEYTDLHCAGDAIWLQPLDVESGQMGRGPTWLRIAADGTIGNVDLPERFRPMRFTADRIWGVHRGDYDIESVAWIASPGY